MSFPIGREREWEKQRRLVSLCDDTKVRAKSEEEEEEGCKCEHAKKIFF